MKKYFAFSQLLLLFVELHAQKNFDIFSYKAPAGFTLKESKGYLYGQNL